jgi:hypothetical protein
LSEAGGEFAIGVSFSTAQAVVKMGGVEDDAEF